MTMTQKATVWYKSRTMWANILLILIGILTALQADVSAGATITFAGILNIVLRVITTTPVKWESE